LSSSGSWEGACNMARAIPLERGLPRFSARPRIGTIAKHAVLIAVAVLVAYPFYFMLTSSFKDVLEAARTPPTIFPTEFHPENYTDAWNRAPWGRYFVNTIFVSVTVTVLEPERARRRGPDRRRRSPSIPLEHRSAALRPGADHGRPHHLPRLVERVPVAPHRDLEAGLPARSGWSVGVPAGSGVELPSAHG